MTRKRKPKSTIAVVDFETDPFLYGRTPKPFAAGFYDGNVYLDFWGDDCAMQLCDYLRSRKDPLTIYAHNGGKFDFFFFLELGLIENPVLIINGRIVKAAFLGIHELRDSYAIMPAQLAKIGNSKIGDKLEIDYTKLERSVREEHKEEILIYQKQDCVVLWNAVFEFRERYGNKLTVGAMAIAELGKFHPVSRQNKGHDKTFRPYYFGGRVQCFESGRLPGKWKIYDVNSMYPAVMKNYDHPTGPNYVSLGPQVISKFNRHTGELDKFGGMYFMRFVGYSKCALPRRNDETGVLEFPEMIGEFFACSHEIKAACELGLLKVHTIIDVRVPCSYLNFAEFVDTGIEEKYVAKRNDDAISEFFAKLKLNSAYGKFGSNPATFKEFFIYDAQCSTEEHDKFIQWIEANPKEFDQETGKLISNGAELVQDLGRFEIWQCPAPNDDGYFDVAVAASITSAARSVLLRAIHNAHRPVYCDTDSLICESLSGVDIDPMLLGAWKCEGTTDEIFIAGKKLYSCVLNERGKKGEVKHKIASKGAKLNHDDVVRLCRGETVHWKSDAPNFKFSGEVKFVARNIRKNI